MTQQFAIFETAIGRCGIAWGDAGVLGVQLPERGESDTRARMRAFPRRAGSIATTRGAAHVRRHHGAAVRRGERSLHRRARHGAGAGVPPPRLRDRPDDSPGRDARVRRDRDPARRRERRARWGRRSGKTRFAIVVPCHRVVAAGGKLGGFSANGGVTTKLKMLAIEGAVVNHTPNLFDQA